MYKSILSLLISLTLSQQAIAWGERGHHAVGFIAAYDIQEWLDEADLKAAKFAFVERAHMLGHLNNIPDVSWKGVANKTAQKFNRSNHYFDPELLFNNESFDEITKKIHELPLTYKELHKKYKDKKNPYTGEDFDIYTHVGTAPYRIQQMYQLMVEAFKCAKNNKKAIDKKSRKAMLKLNGEKNVKKLKCSKSTTYAHALLGAFVSAGIMGHYVADLAQPLHTTADYNGFAHGQGGLHGYFEDDLVGEMPLDLEAKIKQRLADKKFRASLKKKLKTNEKAKVVEIIYSLIQDTRNNYQELINLDKKYALIEKGDVVPMGVEAKKPKKAKRKEFDQLSENKALINLTVDRLATGSYVLSYLWHRAWTESGKPELSTVSKIVTVYPLDVGFIEPDFM